MSPAAPAPHRIDVHAHYLAPAYTEALRREEMWLIGGIPVPDWSPELALEFMDAHGIAVQMLSVSDPGVEFVGPLHAGALARSCNDYLAGVISARPERFGGFAVLAMHDVHEATHEAVRCLDELQLDGVALLSSYEGAYLGDERFASLLDELDARGAWVMVHPASIARGLTPELSIPGFIAEYPFDTTRAFLSLLFNGVLETRPSIRWQFAHGGGTLPMLRARLAAASAAAKELGPFLGLPAGSGVLEGESAHRALRDCFYDTALVADEPALAAVRGVAAQGHVLFGSDWPFAARMYAADGDPQPALGRVFAAEELSVIEAHGAGAQFPRLANAPQQRPASR
jgi:predicted TIM-barrel fold metal-dependent hydrolase